NDADKKKTIIVRCKEFPGIALQTALEGRRVSTDFYEIYETDQTTFKDDFWQILTSEQMVLKAKISEFPILDNYLVIKEGFVTGKDDIFIRDISEIPKGEEGGYIPYLSDREMDKYTVPKSTNRVVFYPYLNKVKLIEKDVKKHFPETWNYLRKNSKVLKGRKAAKDNPWWCPVRPRTPKDMLTPKIVSPHLVLLSKFSLDIEGKYGVSHCPLMYPKDPKGGIDILYYFLAVLNSSVAFWQIANLSHKYSRGYFMLEPKTLKKLRVPDPAAIPSATMKKIYRLVKKRIEDSSSSVDVEIDNIIADIYGLSEGDRQEVGMEE
ncbi:MAG: hypothetical protein KAS04_05340, partial [Candidatus Aenigmarchaeota archaeon]|nr:hypothetical protein [Candidatus Aenigmarchaeota archaeon]